MAGEKERYKKALERYAKHLQEIRNITSVIPKGTDAERASRMARAREDYDFFVHAYFPHLATSRCGKFQIEAAEYIKTIHAHGAYSNGLVAMRKVHTYR